MPEPEKNFGVTGKIYGQLVAEGKQVAMVRDTSQTTMFSAINSRHGDTVVEQFNYETGKTALPAFRPDCGQRSVCHNR